MDYVIIQSMDKEVEEILTDIDYGSFSYDYEKYKSCYFVYCEQNETECSNF